MTWYVGNSKQAASYYVTRMGFSIVAYSGLETGSRSLASHVVSNGAATLVLVSPIRAATDLDPNTPLPERKLLDEVYRHLAQHGDGIKDVAFEVDNVRAVYDRAIAQGAVSVHEPRQLIDDNDGEVVSATIKTFGDTTHTLVNCSRYSGSFMPGYRSVTAVDPINQFLPNVPLEVIDHCVGNQDWAQMEAACE